MTSTDRRGFLRHSLTILGTAATGTAAYKAVAATHAASASVTGAAVPTTGTALAPAESRVFHLPMAMDAGGGGSMAMKAADPTGRQGVPGKRWIMVIDLAKCDGCGKCTTACGKMHFIPPDRTYIPVLEMHDAQLETAYFLPRPCYQCDEPPCTKVCPVNATYKTQDGTVLIDNERCIGCRFCVAACPYGARSFNWGDPEFSAGQSAEYSPEWGFPRKVGTVEKCDFCPEHAAMGMLPACSSACPMGAIYYGDENEDAVTNSAGETMRLSTLLRDRAGYRDMESLGTKPRVYYLPPVHRQFPAPGEAKTKAMEMGK